MNRSESNSEISSDFIRSAKQPKAQHVCLSQKRLHGLMRPSLPCLPSVPSLVGLLAYLVCIALAFHGSTHRFETLVFLYLGLGLTRRQMMFPRLHRHSHFSRQSIKSRRRSITQEVYKEFTQIVMIFLS